MRIQGGGPPAILAVFVAGNLAERQRQNLPTLCQKRKGWATRKIKGRTNTGQLQNELPGWVNRQ
jgi:hypothetical protein